MKLLEKLRARPEWQDPDPTVRASAVRDMPDGESSAEALLEIARTDADAVVRCEATRRLAGIEDVLSIARTDLDETVRATACERLRAHLLDTPSDQDIDALMACLPARDLVTVARSARAEGVSLAAASRVTDAKGLGAIARGARHFETAKAALDRLEDVASFLDVAIKTADRAIGLLAFERLPAEMDASALEMLAKRARQKAVARRARARLAELGATEPDLAGAEPTPAAPAAALPPVSPEGPADFAAERSAREERQRQRDESLAVRRRLCEQVEALDGADLDERLAELRAEWEELGVPPAGLIRADALSKLADRFRDAVTRCQQRAKQRKSEVSQAGPRGVHEDPDRKRAETHPAPPAEDDSERQANLTRLEKLCQTIEALVADSSPGRQTAERHLREARQALDGLQAKPSRVTLPSRRTHESVSKRLRRAHTALLGRVRELRDFDDWQRWANLGVQERLCAELEALASISDDGEMAARYQEIMRQWRQASELPKGREGSLRERFEAAHAAVHPRCAAYLESQAEEREQNLEHRRRLVAEVEQLAHSTDWIATAKRITALQAEWKAVGPVPRPHQRETWARFRQACNTFFTRRKADLAQRKEEWARNLALKQALCARVEALQEEPDVSAAVRAVRQIQDEWKAVGPVRRKQSDAVWRRFRTACDALHARLREAETRAAEDKLAVREALCAELKALLPTDGSPPRPADAVAQTVSDIQGRWRAAPEVPPASHRRLLAEFEQALASVAAAHPEVFRGTELDPARRLRRLEALCERAEALATQLETRKAEATASPAEILATKWRDALARNTMGAHEDEAASRRSAREGIRKMQTEQRRLGAVAGPEASTLLARFQHACDRVLAAARD